MTHTKGPWFIAPLFKMHGMTTNDGAVTIMAPTDNKDSPADSFPVALALLTIDAKRGQKHKADDPTRNANACVLAAGADMLEVLKEGIEFWDDEDGDNLTEWRAKARVIIAKAEGRE